MRHYCSFSEAIREGAKMRPAQAFRKFYDPETGGTCATGAALEAIFDEPFTNELLLERWDEVGRVIRSDFPYLVGLEVEMPCECPRLHDGPSGLRAEGRIHRPDAIAVHLNNHHRWTREQIADWFESVEENIGFVTLTPSVEAAEAATASPAGDAR